MSDQLKKLYRLCWDELKKIKKNHPDLLDKEATPVLVFGNFSRAKLITAGLNPSKNEFRENGSPLKPGKRRFLHFSEVSSTLEDFDIKVAFERSIHYFSRNPYNQ